MRGIKDQFICLKFNPCQNCLPVPKMAVILKDFPTGLSPNHVHCKKFVNIRDV